jgi:EAL domain-containing protein (putative c-di-GMP-specific phosphodiesterase class I)
VEQPYQRDRLVELGCQAFQGWLFSAAVPSGEIISMLPATNPAAAPSRPGGQTSQRSPL